MLRDFSVVLKNLAKEDLVDAEKPITLSMVCVNALHATFEDERIDGNEKCKRGLLAEKLYEAKKVEVTAEEIALLKTLIGKGFGVLIVSQSYKLLED